MTLLIPSNPVDASRAALKAPGGGGERSWYPRAPRPSQAEASRLAAQTPLVQDQGLAGVALLEATCFPRAGPEASWEEVTSSRTPLATLLALAHPLSASFLPEPRVADLLTAQKLSVSPRKQPPGLTETWGARRSCRAFGGSGRPGSLEESEWPGAPSSADSAAQAAGLHRGRKRKKETGLVF